MLRYPATVLAIGLLAALACDRSTSSVASGPICERGLVASWSPDSAVALCLPPGFGPATHARGGHARWERGNVDSPDRAWLSIDVGSADADGERWPPHLASRADCSADCASTDSVVQYRDAVATGVAAVEVGLVSGGYPGFRRQPLMVAGWKTPAGRRVWVNGLAATAPVLDTLRAALRSVQLRDR